MTVQRFLFLVLLAGLAFWGCSLQASASAESASGARLYASSGHQGSKDTWRAASDDDPTTDMDDDDDGDGSDLTPVVDPVLQTLDGNGIDVPPNAFGPASAGSMTEPPALPTHPQALRRRIFKKSW